MIDLAYFWKVFTAVGASIVTIAGIWRAIKEIKANTAHAKLERQKKEEREKALTVIAEHAPLIADYTKATQEQELLKDGMIALLRFRINKIIAAIKDKGYMSIDEHLDLKDLYQAYKGLGGNSRTQGLYEDVMARFDISDDEGWS